MQTVQYEDHGSAPTPASEKAEGFLAHSNRVELYRQDVLIATCYENFSAEEGSKQLEDGTLEFKLWSFHSLIWSHPSAMCLVQGMSPQLLLGKKYVLLSAGTVPLYSVPPRLTAPTIAEVLDASTCSLKTRDVFNALVDLTLLKKG